MLEKLRTKNGSSSIGIILIFTCFLVFMCLPVFAVLVDRCLLRIAAQEIVDEIDSELYQLYHHLDLDDLSQRTLVIEDSLLNDMNQGINLNNPIIHEVSLTNIQLIKHQTYQLTLNIEMVLRPTLYRDFYDLDQVYHFSYTVAVPID